MSHVRIENGVTPCPENKVQRKVEQLIKIVRKRRDFKRKEGDPGIPDGKLLFDIALCKCFPKGITRANFKTRQCTCSALLT